MPTPVMVQPIRIAAGDAPRDMSEGKLKTPPPIMDPTTRAMRGSSVNFCDLGGAVSAVACAVVKIRSSPKAYVQTPPRLPVIAGSPARTVYHSLVLIPRLPRLSVSEGSSPKR